MEEKMELKRVWQIVPAGALNFLLHREFVRKVVLKKAEKELYKEFVVLNKEKRPLLIQEGRCQVLKNLLQSVDRALSDGRLSPKVSKAIIKNFAGKVLMSESERTRNFTDRYGFAPPAFVTISPTKKCNLMCKGCSAANSAGNGETLPYDALNRMIREKTELWGSHFTVVSGGEPLLYQNYDGKTLFDLFEENRDNYFMMYTNGTLITEEVASRMADLGNITPAISVEGFEKETDDRRGKGVFNGIHIGMENLRKAGVPFGVSVTATRNNADIVMSGDFISHYFNKEGAIYGWISRYMPIGRSYTPDLTLAPEQRLAMFRKEQQIIRERNLFVVDFWNGGSYAVGCISAGRPGGYFYIDWNGNISPSVFSPHPVANILDIYTGNKTLNDVLFSPFFESIRNRQNEYGYNHPPDQFGANPMDTDAACALSDEEYRKKLIDCGKEAKSLTQGYRDEEFMNTGIEGEEITYR